jgi:hypothetical protein
MLIDTDTLDTRAVATHVLKHGGMDWIDTPADELWGELEPEMRAEREEWREGIISEKQQQIIELIRTVTQVASAD